VPTSLLTTQLTHIKPPGSLSCILLFLLLSGHSMPRSLLGIVHGTVHCCCALNEAAATHSGQALAQVLLGQ
jgi:hypothetical protein